MAHGLKSSPARRVIRGSAMVETVFTISLMLFIVFAGLEISWAVYKKAEVSNAARLVARGALRGVAALVRRLRLSRLRAHLLRRYRR